MFASIGKIAYDYMIRIILMNNRYIPDASICRFTRIRYFENALLVYHMVSQSDNYVAKYTLRY